MHALHGLPQHASTGTGPSNVLQNRVQEGAKSDAAHGATAAKPCEHCVSARPGAYSPSAAAPEPEAFCCAARSSFWRLTTCTGRHPGEGGWSQPAGERRGKAAYLGLDIFHLLLHLGELVVKAFPAQRAAGGGVGPSRLAAAPERAAAYTWRLRRSMRLFTFVRASSTSWWTRTGPTNLKTRAPSSRPSISCTRVVQQASAPRASGLVIIAHDSGRRLRRKGGAGPGPARQRTC